MIIMKLIKKITDKEIVGADRLSSASPRVAVRAVLLDDREEMAVMYMGKYGFYTIPGGGVETGETLEAALKREIREETGCECEILQELGYIEENRAEHNFTQISNYYLAKVIGEKGLPCLTEEEKGGDIRVEWHPIREVFDMIASPVHEKYQRKYIQCRDVAVLKEAIKKSPKLLNL